MDKLLFIPQHYDLAKSIASDLFEAKPRCIAIGGKSGTGKSEVAIILKHIYCLMGKSVKVFYLDNFYLPGHNEKRKQDINNVGQKEIDWVRLNNAVGNHYFARTHDLIIVEGLYALYCLYADIRYYISQSYEDSYSFRKQRGKENPDCEFRKKVLEHEAVDVRKTKEIADKVVGYEVPFSDDQVDRCYI